jgi:NDP-sugar pyrophosphorylase family protein
MSAKCRHCAGGVSRFSDLVLKLIAADEKVCAMPCDCLWLDIGQPDDYARAQEIYSEGGQVD